MEAAQASPPPPPSGPTRTTVVLVVMAMVVALVMVLAIMKAGREDETDASATRPGMAEAGPTRDTSRIPTEASAGARTALENYVDAYNAGRYESTLAYVAGDVVAECGSGLAYSRALSQNAETEGRVYEVVRFEATSMTGDRLTADVYVDSLDPSTGEQWDDDLGMGLSFERFGNGWFLADAFPLGAPAFC